MLFYSLDHYGSGDFATFYEAINLSASQKPGAVCRLLSIQPKTLKNYLSGKATPPPALVRLLFHECHYGRAATDAHAHAGHIYALRLSKSLQAENDVLRALITALEIENQELKQASACGEVLAANSSRWRV